MPRNCVLVSVATPRTRPPVVATIGYAIAGVPDPVVFGVLSLAASFIPIGGVSLASNRFPGTIHPRGFEHIVSFSRDVFPVWEYEVDGVRLRKTVVAARGPPLYRLAPKNSPPA